jgi:hypothetical protein
MRICVVSSASAALTQRQPLPRAVKNCRCLAEEQATQKLILVLETFGLINSVRLFQSVTPQISYTYLNGWLRCHAFTYIAISISTHELVIWPHFSWGLTSFFSTDRGGDPQSVDLHSVPVFWPLPHDPAGEHRYLNPRPHVHAHEQ